MIQIKRGSTNSWKRQTKPLAAGQPGYDKEKNKIKIGTGTALWDDLPYASGLNRNDIIMPENEAKVRHLLDHDDNTLITYGTEAPNENLVGELYLQYYDTEPEVDYVVESGINGIWRYQIWHSGLAQCWGTLPVQVDIQSKTEEQLIYYSESSIGKVEYPFEFSDKPSEIATIQSNSGIVWLAGVETENTTKKSAAYKILSTDQQPSNRYRLSLQVTGQREN